MPEPDAVPFLDPARPVSIRRLEQVTSLSREQLDELPLGVIQTDGDGTVLVYNRTEARLAGKRPDDVVGKNFFTEVAPCTNVQAFAGRFRKELGPGKPPIVFPYDFVFGDRRAHVTIAMHWDDERERAWILVQEAVGA